MAPDQLSTDPEGHRSPPQRIHVGADLNPQTPPGKLGNRHVAARGEIGVGWKSRNDPSNIDHERSDFRRWILRSG